jgi:uncharacterized repeat protein (TIGR03943 family)
VRRNTQVAVTIGLGLAVGSLLHSGVYLRYVRPQMHPVLVATSVALVAVGVISLVPAPCARRQARAAQHDHSPGHRDGDRHRSRAAWFLVVPILATLVPPPALGASSIGRVAALTPSSTAYAAPLSPGTPALTLSEFATRATYGRSLAGHDVILEGFSSRSASGGWNLTRMVIRCCAADALAIQVHIDNAPDPGVNAWARVTGRWDGDRNLASLAATHVDLIQQPSNPYE